MRALKAFASVLSPDSQLLASTFDSLARTIELAAVTDIVIGVLLFYVANLIFNITLPVFMGITHLYYFGDYSLLFIVGFTAYAIVRHRLLDIRTVIFRSVAFAVLTSLFFVAYGLIAYWAFRYIKQFNFSAGQQAVLSVVGLMLAIPAFRYFRTALRKITDRFLFQIRANYQRALVDFGGELSGTIQIEEVTDTVLRVMSEVLRARKAAILLHRPETNTLEPRAQYGMNNFQVIVQPDNVLLMHLKRDQHIIARDELLLEKEQQESLARGKEINVIQNALLWLDVSVVVPLFIHKELTGLILIGDKSSGEPYFQSDVEFLSAFAPQAATALENARLYKESLEFGEKLKQEVDRATKELAEANMQLKDLDKAKSEFLSIASHQLYTPLTALRGYVSMMQDGDFGKVPKDQQPILDILNKSAFRLIDLIKSLLDISRIERGKLELNLESADLVQMASELVRDLLPNAKKKNLILEFHEPVQPMPHAVVDSQRLRQVMLNFIDNSIKYTDAGRIDVTVDRKGQEIEFAVKDTGKGISKEDLPRLFSKFTRVGSAARFHTEGTGLGLYFAKQIVKEHHGDVIVDSEGEGKGSTFAMRLPIEGSENALKVGEKATVEIKAAEAQGERVRTGL